MANHHSVNFLLNETVLNWRGQKVRAQGVPHTCPHCRKEVGMNLVGIIEGAIENGVELTLLVFQCPSCRELTVGRYYSGANVFTPAHTISESLFFIHNQNFKEQFFHRKYMINFCVLRLSIISLKKQNIMIAKI